MRCALISIVVLLAGCNTFAPNAMPREFSIAVQQVATSITDDATWGKVLARLDGQVIEPGIEGYAGVLYVAGGRLKGASGQIKLEGDGTGSTPPNDEAQAAIRAIAQRPDIIELVFKYLKDHPESKPAATQPAGDVESALNALYNRPDLVDLVLERYAASKAAESATTAPE